MIFSPRAVEYPAQSEDSDQKQRRGHEDKQWLGRAYQYAARDYDLWVHGVHLAGDTGLARYYDLGEGPVPEMGDDPHYYMEVASYLLLHPEDSRYGYLAQRASDSAQPPPQAVAGRVFTVQICDPRGSQSPNGRTCSSPRKLSLSEDYYKGDRSMRESGFDPSNRFGPFSVDITHYNPVCLNSLLYLMEMQTAGFITETSYAALVSDIKQVTDKILTLANSIYSANYCSTKRAGAMHELLFTVTGNPLADINEFVKRFYDPARFTLIRIEKQVERAGGFSVISGR